MFVGWKLVYFCEPYFWCLHRLIIARGWIADIKERLFAIDMYQDQIYHNDSFSIFSELVYTSWTVSVIVSWILEIWVYVRKRNEQSQIAWENEWKHIEIG